MIDSITIGQIAAAVAFLVALIGGISTLNRNLKKYLTTVIKTELDPLKASVESIAGDLKKVDKESCKNYLVRFLSDVEKGNLVDDIEKERFFEEYEHYQKIGGNGYIKHKVDGLKAKGLL